MFSCRRASARQLVNVSVILYHGGLKPALLCFASLPHTLSKINKSLVWVSHIDAKRLAELRHPIAHPVLIAEVADAGPVGNQRFGMTEDVQNLFQLILKAFGLILRCEATFFPFSGPCLISISFSFSAMFTAVFSSQTP